MMVGRGGLEGTGTHGVTWCLELATEKTEARGRQERKPRGEGGRTYKVSVPNREGCPNWKKKKRVGKGEAGFCGGSAMWGCR